MINIKICTFPRKEVSVQHDIDIIKSIILYADNIELVSPNTTMLLSVYALPYLDESDQILFLKQTYPLLVTDKKKISDFDNMISEYEKLLKKKRKPRDELLLFLKIKNRLKKSWDQLRIGVEDKFNNTGIKELLPAIEEKILKINRMGTKEKDFEDDNFANLLIENIKDSILKNNIYPLFDEKIGDLVGAMSKEGIIEISNINKERTNHIAFTSNILERLPSFSDQKIDELIDIRKDLQKYLINFRSAMVKYSSTIENLPWDKDFPKECEKLLISDVYPTIEAIEEQVKANSYLRKLAKTFFNDPLTVAPYTALGLIISQLSTLSTLSTVGLGLSAGTAVAVDKSVTKWMDEKKDIEKNQLFFYYKAGKKIAI